MYSYSILQAKSPMSIPIADIAKERRLHNFLGPAAIGTYYIADRSAIRLVVFWISPGITALQLTGAVQNEPRDQAFPLT